MKAQAVRLVGVVSLLLAGACGGEMPEEGDRGPIGKADLTGTCTADSCGGTSDGNCFCDDDCHLYGDCCENKLDVCGGGPTMTFSTYNTGLVDAVGLNKERLQPIIDALSESPADVLCLQEVWSDEDAEAIRAGLEQTFPHSFREVTSDDQTQSLACGPIKVWKMNSCVKKECIPNGISLFECIADQCADVYDDLSTECKLCLSANTESPLRCVLFGADVYANEGRNGLMMLSRHEFDRVEYQEFDTQLIKRGVIAADIRGVQTQCTHMTPDLERIPYPQGKTFGTWLDEHQAQVEIMAEQAADRCTILMGDLNAGPESNGVNGELAENFQSVVEAGYTDGWTEEPVCTHCSSNPLVGGNHSSRIDHIMFKNCGDNVESAYQRTYDGPLQVTSEGRSLDTALSDHYGVSATVTLGAEALE